MGKDNSIGKMIHDARKQRNTRAKQLCRGLCSEAALSKYENGERIPDSLLFYTMIGRLGKGVDRFCVLISDKESEYYSWRKQTQKAIESQDWMEVESLLKQYCDENEFDSRTREQYRLFLEYVIQIRKNKDNEKAALTIEKALCCTVVEPLNWNRRVQLLSSDEIFLFLLYLRIGIQTNRVERSKAWCLIREIEDYALAWIDDTFEKATIIPRIVCTKIHLFGSQMTLEERMKEEKLAFEVLKDSSEIYDMPEVLRLLIVDSKEKYPQEYVRYSKQRAALVSWLRRYGHNEVFYPEKWYGVRYQYYLVREYLLRGRERNKLTQEKLSEDICSVETYSRIENGKTSPNYKNFCQLVNKLNLRMGYYQSQIITDNLDDLELMTSQRCACYTMETVKSQELLDELKLRLDMDIPENQQYFAYMQTILDYELNKIDKEEENRRFESILQNSWKVGEIKNQFSKTEKEIVYNIAMYYRKRDPEKAKRIINAVLKNEKRRVDSDWYSNGQLLRLLAGIHADQQNFEESNRMTEQCISQMLDCQDGIMLSACVNILGWNGERTGDKEYKQWYQDAIYLSDLFDNVRIHQTQMAYYEDHVERGKVWY